ncbi:MAG: hypothetical protein E7Z90_05280 [Cyanobacteria bacterium SIG29]|nr:hypothetical protein [Cyanobacteria bacterium SIG29]
MKQTTIMKNNTFFKVFIIVIIGFLFRIYLLDKPEGFWNDEYVGWFIASEQNWKILLEKIITNCHTPLYYLYIKLWMFLFGDSDTTLRWSSVLPSTLSIISMYFVGKELKDKNLAILCSLLTAISSFLIYFAQEFRLYSLIFLISSLICLYFIKVVKDSKPRDLLIFFILNAVLCATHSLGIIFSFFITIMLLIQFNLEKKKINLYYLIPLILTIIALSPILYTFAFSKNLSQFWSDFSINKIAYNLIDYYSPIITNTQNTYSSFISNIFNGIKLNYSFIIFGLTPTIIGILCLIKAILNKNKSLNFLLIASGLFYLTLIVLSILGKLILVTKYSIELYPILIVATAFGLSTIKNIKTKNITISFLILINLLYLCYSPSSVMKIKRTEGHKIAIDLINNSKLKANDYILLTYYDIDRFDRYFNNQKNLNIYSISKFNFNYFMFDEPNYHKLLKTGKIDYKNELISKENVILNNYIDTQILSKLKKNQRIGYLFLNTVSFIDEEKLSEISTNDKEYNNTHLIYLIFSSLKNNIINLSNKKLILEEINSDGDWTLVVYRKD